MGEILGIGVSHYPPLSSKDEDMANILKGRMRDPGVPDEAKDPANWPALMREEWGDDASVTGARKHREKMRHGLEHVREALDEFNPDFVLIWGDDQYENFKESIIPPFCIHAYDDMDVYPWRDASESAMFSEGHADEWGGGKPNVWGEKGNKSIPIKFNKEAAKQLASKLIENDFDMSYSYKPNEHPGLAHAFLNAILYLDYERKGWNYPILPVTINCYGSRIIGYRGFISQLGDERPLDPPSPSPKRVFEMGAAIARIIKESPWRVALLASSSWSHAFLVDKTYRMQPDVEFDKHMYKALTEGNYEEFRNVPLSRIEEAGDQELLNWCALAGAMHTLDYECTWSDFVETYLFNSSKVAAVFKPK
ncbi:DODA-type extradiol aromatic ring-opening family dioxygenase [Kordiimonas pumila]|uniref:Extradiol ring-cleavage dioxygenase n=1 Tax=Kordiimonas pumila TaxID=2161677 RepID=A0ABV7D7J0_9PROT|nr:extradiol ring-cleavage dioxygenase [Kordiimonas pumila]